MAREVAEAEARRFGRAAGLLSIGVGSAGLLTYVYFSLASHNLDRSTTARSSSCGRRSSSPSRSSSGRSSSCSRGRSPSARRTGSRSASRCGSRRRSSSASPPPSPSAPSPCGTRSRTTSCRATRPCTGSWSPPCSPSARASSRAAFWPAAGASPSTPLLLLAESTARVSFALAVAVGIASGQTAVALGIVAAPLLSLTVVPLAFADRAAARSRAAPAPPAAVGPARVHARRGRRLRRRGAADHGQRADPPERRAPAGQGLRGSRGGGLHLQRADDRPRPAGPLPGGGHQPAPAPDAAALQRRRATTRRRSGSRSG